MSQISEISDSPASEAISPIEEVPKSEFNFDLPEHPLEVKETSLIGDVEKVGGFKIMFGKYKGRTFKEILKDRRYCAYVAGLTHVTKCMTLFQSYFSETAFPVF